MSTERRPRLVNGKLSRMYRKWDSMIGRCYRRSHPAWKWYGGKGVGVCDRWRASYDDFVDDMGEAPEGMWLDRIDNGKPYGPGNCRWVTPKESAQNRTQGGGKAVDPDSLRQKALAAGMPYHRIYQRVVMWKWREAVALSTPALKRGRRRPASAWETPTPLERGRPPR